MPHSVKAQIVVDVICSHSYLGYTRFARAANRLRAEGVGVTVEFLPFELAPGASTDGLHIGDPDTLARLAAEVGVATGSVPLAAVRARLDHVRRLGITGVPVFLIENLPPLTGSQTESTLLAALRQASVKKGEHRDR
ncbi:DsbA family protein [Streptosporangium sp. NPDC000396]|uniref:DsbA family oxidoreductase n=1 Tax=Streptosporangium sp. NPDC000396 TaxID=3366185 RepID=UPI0036C58A16